MATYCGFCRSNYFKVKDLGAFKEFCERFDLELIQDEKESMVGFIVKEGGIPFRWDEETNEEIDFIAALSEQLAVGEVAIVHEIGYEKMRYLNAYGIAVNWKNESKDISFAELYERAKTLAGKGHQVTPAEY